MPAFRTVLEQKIRERRQTFEEFAEYAERFAQGHGEVGTLSVRHLQRLAAGRGPGGRPLGPVRPATARLLEQIFGLDIDELLAPPSTASQAVAASRNESELAMAFDWLDHRAGWPPGSTQREVSALLATSWRASTSLRRIRRSEVVRGLLDYYDGTRALVDHRIYEARCDGWCATTSILTPRAALNTAHPLAPGADRLSWPAQSPGVRSLWPSVVSGKR